VMVVDYLVSPTEPPLIKAMGRVSSAPELRGADIMWHEPEVGLVGIQRKEYTDLINSIKNGMLAKELAKMTPLGMSILVVEGRPRWTVEGVLLHRYISFDKVQYRSFLRSVQLRGVLVDYSEDTADTVVLIESIQKWASKGTHRSLDRRPKPKGTPSNWGYVTNKEWASHMLQSIPTIGPAQADAIFDHFGGSLPIALTVTEKELLEVPGVGPKTAKKIVAAFRGRTADSIKGG
jgi:ERCC4-type nuclease